MRLSDVLKEASKRVEYTNFERWADAVHRKGYDVISGTGDWDHTAIDDDTAEEKGEFKIDRGSQSNGKGYLLEAESTMGIIDREIDRMAKDKKVGQTDDVKARNAYSRGFRSVFTGGMDVDSGIGQAFTKYVTQGIKDAKVEIKKHKDLPVASTKNRYGEKKKNAEFEKIVKAAMAPYLDKLFK